VLFFSKLSRSSGIKP